MLAVPAVDALVLHCHPKDGDALLGAVWGRDSRMDIVGELGRWRAGRSMHEVLHEDVLVVLKDKVGVRVLLAVHTRDVLGLGEELGLQLPLEVLGRVTILWRPRLDAAWGIAIWPPGEVESLGEARPA